MAKGRTPCHARNPSPPRRGIFRISYAGCFCLLAVAEDECVKPVMMVFAYGHLTACLGLGVSKGLPEGETRALRCEGSPGKIPDILAPKSG